jgi:hypothetical protein
MTAQILCENPQICLNHLIKNCVIRNSLTNKPVCDQGGRGKNEGDRAWHYEEANRSTSSAPASVMLTRIAAKIASALSSKKKS